MSTTVLKTVPYIKLRKDGKVQKQIKYNKNGTVNRSKCNKQKGKSSEVFSLKTKEQIAQMITEFDKQIENVPYNEKQNKKIAERNKLLFVLGINLGVRASDLCTLKFSFFFNNNGEFNDFYSIKPKKTEKYGKFIKLFFNNSVKKAILEYIKKYPYDSLEDYVFFSNKAGYKTISEKSMWRIMDETAKAAGIPQNIGSHSLRKTFGYWVWHNAEDKNKALVLLQGIFNHSNTAVTMRYIGIADEEYQQVFDNLELGLDLI